ncbi:MAG: Uma2 family endonuclease [Blastocatellia bacterium]
MSAQPKLKYSLEEYLELDRNSEERWEFWDGEIFNMSGVSRNHGLVEMNISVFLGARLMAKGCQLLPANIRIKVPSMPPYRYGDLSALCGQPKFEKIGGVDALTNPSLIIEVLSDSTEAYDRGDKFTHYKSIPAFSEYLLVAQHRPHISQFVKQADGSWIYREFNSLSDKVKLETLGCELSLSEIYQSITFDTSKSVV